MSIPKLIGMLDFEVVFEIVDRFELLIAHVAVVTISWFRVPELPDSLLTFKIIEVVLVKRASAWVNGDVVTFEYLIDEVVNLIVNGLTVGYWTVIPDDLLICDCWNHKTA